MTNDICNDDTTSVLPSRLRTKNIKISSVQPYIPQQAVICSILVGFVTCNVVYIFLECSPVIDRNRPVRDEREHVKIFPKNIKHVTNKFEHEW